MLLVLSAVFLPEPILLLDSYGKDGHEQSEKRERSEPSGTPPARLVDGIKGKLSVPE